MVKKNACVFISGTGNNLKYLIKSSRSYTFPINIKLIISNKNNAIGLKFAKKFTIPFKLIKTEDKFSETKILNELIKKKNYLNMFGWLYENIIKKFYQKI